MVPKRIFEEDGIVTKGSRLSTGVSIVSIAAVCLIDDRNWRTDKNYGLTCNSGTE